MEDGGHRTLGQMCNIHRYFQDDDSDPAAGGSAVTAAAAAPRDDDGGDDDDADGGGGSRRKRRQSREGPARAPAADDDGDDAISSPGHPPVLRLSARAPSRRCSHSHPLQTKIGLVNDALPPHDGKSPNTSL
ncbi:uncharacterized protein LOC116849145 [Odontomachus brunneus]|uniref:uncharacterized protein LOC116849145 n=1 Tax=Odontomachus brunneus TaxID=486640 RepID=UPI0013F25668|nr:uncharacterized protein LOC116849145 [Odontomachus brunneus]